jgi:hypothetical protein
VEVEPNIGDSRRFVRRTSRAKKAKEREIQLDLCCKQGDRIGRIFARWMIVYFGRFFENGRSSAHFGVLFSTVKVAIFFTNSSCHPGCKQCDQIWRDFSVQKYPTYIFVHFVFFLILLFGSNYTPFFKRIMLEVKNIADEHIPFFEFGTKCVISKQNCLVTLVAIRLLYV